jgi:hypothetical protein
MASPTHQPNPELIFDAINAYQKTYALKGAIELEVFTHIGDGATSAEEIALRASADARAMRILCDFLVIQGLLTKTDGAYGLTQDSAIFLNKRSPAYMGSVGKFLINDDLMGSFKDVAALWSRTTRSGWSSRAAWCR